MNFTARAVFNGFLSWLISMGLNILMALIYAVWMVRGIDFQKADQSEISIKISTGIGSLYRESLTVILLSALVSSLVIFWRSYRTSGNSGESGIKAGLIVSGITVLLSAYFFFEGGFGLREVIIIIAYFSAGIAGGKMAEKAGTRQLKDA